MSEQIIFESTMAVLARSVRAAGSPPGCVARLKALGFDLDAPLQPNYPAALWADCVRVIAEELHPGLDPVEAHHRVGARAVELFVESALGTAMFALLRLVGPDRTVARMTHNLRSGCSYLLTRALEVRPHTYDLWLNEVSGVPGFYRGLLECGLRSVGARNLSVTILDCDGHQCTYRAAWS